MNLTPEQREKLKAAAEMAVANPFCQDDRDEVARRATPSVILALLDQVEAPSAVSGHTLMDNEALQSLYIRLSGKREHTSTCATSRAPAETPGECDCDLETPKEVGHG